MRGLTDLQRSVLERGIERRNGILVRYPMNDVERWDRHHIAVDCAARGLGSVVVMPINDEGPFMVFIANGDAELALRVDAARRATE